MGLEPVRSALGDRFDCRSGSSSGCPRVWEPTRTTYLQRAETPARSPPRWAEPRESGAVPYGWITARRQSSLRRIDVGGGSVSTPTVMQLRSERDSLVLDDRQEPHGD